MKNQGKSGMPHVLRYDKNMRKSELWMVVVRKHLMLPEYMEGIAKGYVKDYGNGQVAIRNKALENVLHERVWGKSG